MFACSAAKFDKIHVKFVRNWYEFRTNEYAKQVCEYRGFYEIGTKFVPISYEFHANLCECRPICSFHRCIVPSLLPLPQLVPYTLCPVCRPRSTRGPRRSGTTPGGGSRRTIVCRCPARRASRPTAPGVDGPRARPPGSARKPPRARDALRGPQRGQLGCGVIVPMPSREDLGTAHLNPPWPGSPWPPGSRIRPAWQQRVAPGPDGRQPHLSAVGDLAVEPRGVGRPSHLLPLRPCNLGGTASATRVWGGPGSTQWGHGHGNLCRESPCPPFPNPLGLGIGRGPKFLRAYGGP